MTVFEAVSPTLNEPIDFTLCDSDCARWTEESALDRWTNEGGALEGSRLVRDMSVGNRRAELVTQRLWQDASFRDATDRNKPANSQKVILQLHLI